MPATRWGFKSLGELTEKIGSGATPRGGKDAYKEQGISLIRSLNVHDLEFRHANLARIDDAQADALANVEVQARDVLLNITGASIARCTQVPKDILPARVNQHVAILRPKNDILDSRFLSYLLVAREAKDRLLTIGDKAGATRQALTKEQLQNFKVPLPSMEEQKRIVAVLDQAFAALDRARAHAEANLADANLLYASTVDELMQRHRSGWQNGTVNELVGEVATGPFGSLLHKSDYVEAGIPIVNPSNIVNGVIEPDWSKTVSAEAAERLQSYRLHEGDLVVGRRGEMGRCAFVPADVDGWLCGTGSFFIRTRSGVSPEFVAYLIRSRTVVDTLTAISTGATMPNLSNRALGEMALALPDLETQLAILAQVKRIESKTKELCSRFNAKLADLADLRQSLLQKAFAGELT